MTAISKLLQIGFAIAITAISTTSAVAADAEGAHSPWTGFYVGVSAGQALTQQSFSTSPSGTLVTSPFIGSTRWGENSTRESDGLFIGGVQFGYNWTFSDRYIVGIEADIRSNDQSFQSQSVFSPAAGITVTNTSTSSLPMVSTLRGRLGYLVQSNFLLYGTAGLAYGEQKGTFTQSVSAGNTLVEIFPVNLSKSAYGYSTGVGVEWAFARQWSVGAEYQYLSLATKQTQMISTAYLGPSALASDVMSVSSSEFKVNVLQLGVNYRF
ncbi:MAG: porin family protein [Azonexaceae bacterium]|nr:porin family protein [Azonexaceae bacterium]